MLVSGVRPAPEHGAGRGRGDDHDGGDRRRDLRGGVPHHQEEYSDVVRAGRWSYFGFSSAQSGHLSLAHSKICNLGINSFFKPTDRNL